MVGQDKQLRTMRAENEELKRNASDGQATAELKTQLSAKAERYESQIRHLEEDKAELETKRARLESDLREQKEEARSLRSQAASGASEVSSLSDELESVKRALESAQTQIAAASDSSRAASEEADEAGRAARKATAEAEKTASRLAETEAELATKTEELATREKEATEAESRAVELEGELQGLKSMVEKLQLVGGGAESGESNGGWSDLGAEATESEEARRERLAQLTNAAQLHGQLKKALAEAERARSGAQREADARVKLELRLTEKEEEMTARAEKLERTEGERSELLKQVTQLTAMISAKESESVKVREELQRNLEKLGSENRNLLEDLEHQKNKRTIWEDKCAEKDDLVRSLHKEYDRKEMKFYQDLKESESRIRTLEMQNMQVHTYFQCGKRRMGVGGLKKMVLAVRAGGGVS